MRMRYVMRAMLICGLVGACDLSLGKSAEHEGQEPREGEQAHAATLPSLVARVNVVEITRETVLVRLEQYMTMMVHELGSPSRDPASANLPFASNPDHAQVILKKERGLLGHIIRQLIVDELKAQEATRLGLTVSPDLLEANVSKIEQQAGSRQALIEQLERGRNTVEQWSAQLRQALLVQALAARRQAEIPISDDEIRHYWENNLQALSSLWDTDQLPLVRDRLRDVLRQARWPAAETNWEKELTRNSSIWVDPGLHEQGIRWEVAEE
jgi:hypothetical protein